MHRNQIICCYVDPPSFFITFHSTFAVSVGALDPPPSASVWQLPAGWNFGGRRWWEGEGLSREREGGRESRRVKLHVWATHVETLYCILQFADAGFGFLLSALAFVEFLSFCSYLATLEMRVYEIFS